MHSEAQSTWAPVTWMGNLAGSLSRLDAALSWRQGLATLVVAREKVLTRVQLAIGS